MDGTQYTYDLTRNGWEPLRLLWNRFHGQNEMSDHEVVQAWNALEKYGFWCLRNKVMGVRRLNDGNPTQDEISIWGDFIKDLMIGPFRKVMQIKSGTSLEREFWKYRMRFLMPCYKEVYDVLSEVLNQLVSSGELCRTESQTIGDDTMFWRSDVSSTREADMDKCEQCCSKIADIGLRMDQRGFATIKKRMVTPKCASKFVMRLFEELGGGYRVSMEVLKHCIFLKTRNMFSLQAVEYKDEIGSSDEWEALDGMEQESLPNQQQQKLAKAVALRIWNRIGGMGEDDQRILAGYIFPKMAREKVSMRAFGKNTTVDYRIEKIFGVIRSELKAAMPQEIGSSYVEDPVVQLTMVALRDFCSEDLGNVCLDCSDEKRKDRNNDSQH